MYIKIMRNIQPALDLGLQSSETIQEVKDFSHYTSRPSKDEVELTIVLDGKEETFGEYDDVDIYIMNGDGKTIDKVIWNELTRHPEILA